MLGSDVTTRVKWRCLLLPARNASEREGEGERSGKVPSIQNKMADVFSIFHTTRSRSFVLMQAFSLFCLLTDKSRTAVKVNLFANISAVFFLCTLNGHRP